MLLKNKKSCIWAGLISSLAACGGGGSGSQSSEAALAPTPAASQSSAPVSTPLPAASIPSTPQTQASISGTYVGHWYGTDYQRGVTMTTWLGAGLGGMLLNFEEGANQKLRAIGFSDVLGHGEIWKTSFETFDYLSIGVGIAGMQYGGDSLNFNGFGNYLFDGSVIGHFHPNQNEIYLESVGPRQSQQGFVHYGLNQASGGTFYAPGVLHAVLRKVGTANPMNLKLSYAQETLSWPAVPGVGHWVISVFRKNAEPTFNHPVSVADNNSPVSVPNGRIDTQNTSIVEPPSLNAFLQRYFLPGNALGTHVELVPGETYVVSLTGLPSVADDIFDMPDAIAYTSKEVTGN